MKSREEIRSEDVAALAELIRRHAVSAIVAIEDGDDATFCFHRDEALRFLKSYRMKQQYEIVDQVLTR